MALTVDIGNPIRVTGTTAVDQAIISPAQSIFIRMLYWFNPTTAGQLCTLKTSKGKYIAELRCEADGFSEKLDIFAYFDDIRCDDMDSGTLYIYTR